MVRDQRDQFLDADVVVPTARSEKAILTLDWSYKSYENKTETLVKGDNMSRTKHTLQSVPLPLIIQQETSLLGDPSHPARAATRKTARRERVSRLGTQFLEGGEVVRPSTILGIFLLSGN